MTDTSGITLRYTCRQRRFEGKLPRHLRVLEKEKAETDGLLQAEMWIGTTIVECVCIHAILCPF